MDDKVSCLMVTENRLPMMQRAIHCFLSQSHPNRELVVVNRADDGTEEYVRHLTTTASRTSDRSDSTCRSENCGTCRLLQPLEPTSWYGTTTIGIIRTGSKFNCQLSWKPVPIFAS